MKHFWKLENNQNNGQMKKKVLLAKLWNLNYSYIERFYRSKFDLIGNGSTKPENFRPIWTQIGQNDPWLINLNLIWSKRPLIGQFGPELTKTAHGGSSTGPNWSITGRFGRFGSKWAENVLVQWTRFLSNPILIDKNAKYKNSSDFKASLKTFQWKVLLSSSARYSGCSLTSSFSQKITNWVFCKKAFRFYSQSRTIWIRASQNFWPKQAFGQFFINFWFFII